MEARWLTGMQPGEGVSEKNWGQVKHAINCLLSHFVMIDSCQENICCRIDGGKKMKARRFIVRFTLSCLIAGFIVIGATSQEAASAAPESAGSTFQPHDSDESVPNPLKPADTYSPRDTLQSFLENMNKSYSVLMAAHQKNLKAPGYFTSGPIRQMERRAETYFDRAIDCLNLGKIPKKLKQDVGYESAILLKEIFDRIKLPPFDKIPFSQTEDAEEKQNRNAELNHWRIPDTEIAIDRVKEGPRVGEFLFSPETIARLEEFYSKVKDLPYKNDALISHEFFDFYTTTPGRLLPPKWSRWLPGWSNETYLDQTIWQWCALFILPIVALLTVWALVRLWYRRAVGFSSGKKTVGWFLIVLVTVAMVSLLKFVLNRQVNITGQVLIFLENTLQWIFLFFLIGLITWEFMKARIQANTGEDASTEESEDEEMGPSGSRSETLLFILRKAIVAVMVSIVFLLLLSSMGINIGPLLAGAGVIGLAIGFGAQTLVRDIFSGIFFLIDDAFRVGDYIETGNMKGRVDRISVRSLTLRHPRGMLITIPFGDLGSVTNYSRDYVIMKLDIRVRYETDVDKVRKIVKKINKALQKDEEIAPGLLGKIKSQGVREMDDSAMIMRVKFKCIPGKQFTLRREVYRRLQESFRENGIEFAHRNVTVYFPTADDKTDQKNQAQDEKTVSITPDQKKEAAAAAALSALESNPKPVK